MPREGKVLETWATELFQKIGFHDGPQFWKRFVALCWISFWKKIAPKPHKMRVPPEIHRRFILGGWNVQFEDAFRIHCWIHFG